MYDVILILEIIYVVEFYVKLYNVIKRYLKKFNGIVYVVVKIYYFGVGGGIRSFEKLVKMDGVFDVFVCKMNIDGV